MTIVNASAATEADNITQTSDQFAFASQDPAGDNSATEYSWLTSGGDDVQAFGTGMDFLNDPPTFGDVTRIEFDLSNNNFQTPDVVIDGITAAVGGGALSAARLEILAAHANQFFNEVTSFNDQMTGSAFNDTFKSAGGADTLNMGAGNDTAFGGIGNDTIDGQVGNDSLSGEAGDDSLRGGTGADVLNGGTGADNMNGGDQNDTYFVDDLLDVAAENFNDVLGGVDTVFATATHTMGFGIENLTQQGIANIAGTGNGNNNVINGNVGDNVLSGLVGNDTLNGTPATTGWTAVSETTP